MSASLINDVGSIIVIGDEPGRMLPSAAGIVTQSNSARQREIYRDTPQKKLSHKKAQEAQKKKAFLAASIPFCAFCAFLWLMILRNLCNLRMKLRTLR